uniref:Uncharacterized protein n=1 Tax=Panagrolaimus sp. ES5 TaxID=591445 RepID=A0AC34GIN0_9BILA
MIHASDHSEVAANIALSSDTFFYPNYTDKTKYNLEIDLWASNRLCPATKQVQYQFEISTKKSSCLFLINKKPSEFTITSKIRGNVQWQKFDIDPLDSPHDNETMARMFINNDGSVIVNYHETDLKCLPLLFENEPSMSIKVKESDRCRFAVVLVSFFILGLGVLNS